MSHFKLVRSFLLFTSLVTVGVIGCGGGQAGPGEADGGNPSSGTEIDGGNRDRGTETARCGDGIVQAPEACDDGNTIDTDGCSNTCVRARCGDGIVQTGEDCDDGNTVDSDSCSNICKHTRCGDGVVQAGEACDDGNTSNSDSCTNSCTIARCGDGFVQAGEACDDGNTSNSDSCTNSCTVARCGDGFVQAGEACDDGNTSNSDSCTNSCTVARCGDGIVQTGEACDDGNASNSDSCTTSCTIARCGDGFVQAGEACDDGNTSNSDLCTNSCTIARCGDGYVQAGEACDESGANTATCTPTCTVPSNNSAVTGEVYLTRMNSTTLQVEGYAYDPDSPNTSVTVHVYIDGVFAGAIAANQDSSYWNSSKGISGNHFFSGPVPVNPKSKRAQVWGINISSNAALNGANNPLIVDPSLGDFCNTLGQGGSLSAGEALYTCNENYYLVMQGDGNLVFYQTATNKAIWNTHTQGHPGAKVYLQVDANFVVYSPTLTALWQSHSSYTMIGEPTLYFDDNGEMYISENSSNSHLWHWP